MERLTLACGGNAVNSVDDLTPEDLVNYFYFNYFSRDMLIVYMNKKLEKKNLLLLKELKIQNHAQF